MGMRAGGKHSKRDLFLDKNKADQKKIILISESNRKLIKCYTSFR